MCGSGDAGKRLHPAELGLVLMVPRDPETLPGEYSWGPGLTPQGLEDAPPSQGGRYRGKSPATEDDLNLRSLADRLNDWNGR